MKRIQPLGNRSISEVTIERLKHKDKEGLMRIPDEVKAEILIYYRDIDPISIAQKFRIPTHTLVDFIEQVQSNSEMREMLSHLVDIHKPLHNELERLTADYARLLI